MPKLRSESPDWIGQAPIVFTNTVDIAASPADVWERIADHVTWTDWFTTLDKVEITEAPAGIGGKRRVTVSRLPIDEEFTAWTDGEQFAFSIVRSALFFVAALAEDVQLTPTADGCRVVYRQGIEPRRGCGWITRKALGGLDAGTAEALQNLKHLVESPA